MKEQAEEFSRVQSKNSFRLQPRLLRQGNMERLECAWGTKEKRWERGSMVKGSKTETFGPGSIRERGWTESMSKARPFGTSNSELIA